MLFIFALKNRIFVCFLFLLSHVFTRTVCKFDTWIINCDDISQPQDAAVILITAFSFYVSF